MDFLNKSLKQITDLFRSMTPAARITAALLLAVVVISLAYLIRFQTSGADEFLLGAREFSQSDLANMEAAFGKAGLSDYEVDGYRVRVPRGQKAVYMAALADSNALPQDFTRHLDEALTSGGFLTTSRHMLEQKLKHAKEKNLSLIISEMKGVESARVQFERDEKRGLRATSEIRAVAAVKPAANNELEDERIVAIRNTVVAGVAGLKPENVTVTDLNSGRAYPGSSSGSGILGIPDSPYAIHKRFHENDYRQKIVEMLKDYPGVVVGVNVELDETLTHEEMTQTFDAKKSVSVSSREVTKNSTTASASNTGRPGAASNGGNSNQSMTLASPQAPESTIEEATNEQQSLPGGTTVTKQIVGLMPRRVYASIGIPSGYYTMVWRERNPPAAGETPREPDAAELNIIEQEVKKNIKEMIVTLLPKRIQGEDPYERVTVITVDQLSSEPIPQPGATETALTWLLGHWQTLAVMLLGLFSLVMLRGMVRSAAQEPPILSEPAISLPTSSTTDLVADEADEQAIRSARRLRFGSGGPNLRGELTQLVKEDPETAANILKNWLSDAA